MSASPADTRGGAQAQAVPLSRLASEVVMEEVVVLGLPPDISYCLDAEMEMGGLGGDDRGYIDLFDVGTVAWFDAISGRDAPRFAELVKARHAAWRVTASPRDAMALDWAGLQGLRWLFNDCALGVASEIRGLLVPGQDQTDGIAARMATSEEARRFASCAAPIVERCRRDVEAWGGHAFLGCRDRAAELYAARRGAIEARDRGIRDLARPAASRTAPRETASSRRKSRRVEGLARRALARSYRTLEGFAGRDRAKAWLSGESVCVEGRRFDFRVRVADLRRTTFGALEVSVTDKDGIELASLCVYAPSTPALDQLSSLVLHVVSGEEDEILRSANVIRSTESAAGNAAFTAVRAGLNGTGMPDILSLDRLSDPRGDNEELRAVARRALAEWARSGVLAPLGAFLADGGALLATLIPAQAPDGFQDAQA